MKIGRPGVHGFSPPGRPDDRWGDAMPATKKRHRGQPHKVLHLTTYQRLEEYLGAFAQGHFHLL